MRERVEALAYKLFIEVKLAATAYREIIVLQAGDNNLALITT